MMFRLQVHPNGIRIPEVVLDDVHLLLAIVRAGQLVGMRPVTERNTTRARARARGKCHMDKCAPNLNQRNKRNP